MMKKLLFIAIIATLATGMAYGQYASPVDFPILLSSNYGELRANHFHSGLDIKTEGVIGKNVRSVDVGYIARIFVSPGGFGKALYINHPDGTSTVYGHLDSFSPEVEKYVRDQQYSNKSFSADLYPTKDRFSVTKGQVIALSGNSGSSGGPHLHFEVRNTASQVPLNPLTKGVVAVTDNIAPKVVTLYWVAIEQVGAVPVHTIIHKIKLPDNASSIANTLKVTNKGYIAVEVKEKKNGSENNFMGPRDISGFIDGSQFFGVTIDNIPFDKTRFSNAVTLPWAESSRNGVYRLCLLPNNPLSIYKNTKNGGFIALADYNVHNIELQITDDCANSSTINFSIERADNVLTPTTHSGEPVLWAQNYTYNSDGLHVEIPGGTLYESSLFSASSMPAPSYSYSPLYTVHKTSELLQKSITIGIDATAIDANLRSKALLGRVSSAGARSAVGGGWKEGGASGVVEALSGSFGRFYIAVDSIAPVIVSPFAQGQDLSARSSMVITVSDNFSGVSSYTATIDGKWALFEHDPKTNRLIHYFDPSRWTKGTNHKLTLELKDAKGNRASFEGSYKW